MITRVSVAAAVCAVLLMDDPAFAQSQPPGALQEVEQLAAQARAAYKRGRFEAAIGYYMRAYHIEPAGALLYNIAYVYDRKLNEAELAITYYRRYIQATDAEPDVVERAIARVSALKQRAKVPFVDSSRPRAPRSTRRAPRPDISTDPNAPMSGREAAGWVALSLGIASLAGAGVMSGIASGTHADFERSTGSLTQRDDLRSTGEDQALAADILWGVGGAAAATGIILLLTADSAPDAASTDWRIRAVPTAGGAMVFLGGTL